MRDFSGVCMDRLWSASGSLWNEFADWDAANEDLYSGSESAHSYDSESDDDWQRGADQEIYATDAVAQSDSEEESYVDLPLAGLGSGGGDLAGL